MGDITITIIKILLTRDGKAKFEEMGDEDKRHYRFYLTVTCDMIRW